MRNLKRFLAVLVVVAVMATSMIPAFAAEDTLTAAEICESLNMLRGSGSGVTDEYLASKPDRVQAAIMLLRLMGLEETAIAEGAELEDNFSDVDGLNKTNRAITAYLKAHPELGFVGDQGKFFPTEKITAQQYFKVLLTALGYEQNVDFAWSEVIEFAASVGIAAGADAEEFTVGDLAEATVEALVANIKGEEEYTLIEWLVDSGFVALEDAIAVGLIEVVEEPAEIAMTVSAKAADAILVSFNQPVDDTKAVFAVKKGSISVNVSKVEFAADKASATLTLANKMTKGEYTVTVSGLTEEALVAKITVEDQKVTKIELTSDKLVIGSKVSDGILVEDRENASVGFKIFDQYGTDVTNSKDGEIEWTVTSATVTSANDGVLKVKYSGDNGFILDMPVVVTGINKVTGASVSATLKVAPMAYIAEVSLGDVTVNPDKDDKVINTDNLENFHVPMTVTDQYGNPMKEEKIVAADLLVMPVNVKATVKTDDDGNLILALEKADNQMEGYAAVNVVAKHSAAKASVEFTVDKVQTIYEFSMELPDLLVAEDRDAVKVPFTALDQYGNEVNDVAALNAMIEKASIAGNTKLDESDFEFKKNYKTDKAELFLDLSGAKDGTAYFTVITPGLKYYQTSFTVQEKAEPVLVSGTKDLILNMVKGTDKAKIKTDNIVLKDQYGRDYSWDNLTDDSYRVVLETSDESKVDFVDRTSTVSKTVYMRNVDGHKEFTLGANDVGSAKITATLEAKEKEKSTYKAVDGSSYTFTLKVVKTTDVKTYEIADIGTMYGGSTDTKYQKTLDIVGKLEDGSKVVLNDDVIVSILSTNTDVLSVVDPDTGTIKAVYNSSGDDVKAGIVVTIETANGVENIFKEVTISYKAPVATKFETTDKVTDGVYELGLTEASDLLSGDVNLNDLGLCLFKVTDQYGVDITTTTNLTYLVTNVVKESDATITLLKGKGTSTLKVENAKAGNNFVLTAITPNGLSESVKIILVEAQP